MSPEFHDKVRQLFDEAMGLPQSKRVRFLDFVCADAPDVRREVARLLEEHEKLEQTRTTIIPAPEAAHRPLISRYEIKSELGHGAAGAVYEAIDKVIGRTVALKVLHSKSLADAAEAKTLEERLFREASSAGRLAHPGIVTIYDVGKENDMAYIAMERVDGPTLQELMKEKKIERPLALDILRQAAAALDYAHAEGIVHRDIKPANIMLHKGVQAKIADFGIAKVSTMSRLTVAGTILGTPSYMSPEQIQNLPLTGRSDQFSLSVVAFELLTGSRPFERDTVTALLVTIVNGKRPPASSIDPTLPQQVDDVLFMAMSAAADSRFETCTAFINALANAVGGSPAVQRRTPQTLPPPQPPPQPVPLSMLETAVDLSPRPAPLPPPPLPLPPLPPPPFQPRQGLQPPPVASHPQETPTKSSAFGIYVGIALGVVVLASAWPVYRYLTPKTSPQPREQAPREQAATVTAPPTTPVSPPANDAIPAPPIDFGKDAPAPLLPELPAEKASPSKPVETPAKPAALPADPAKAQRLYEEGVVKARTAAAGAVPTFQQAAALGEPRAMLELGRLYSTGDGVGKDATEAARWFQQSAELGNTSAMVFLGAAYVQGSGVPKDLQAAARWLRKAADGGNAVAMDGLGQMYANGQGVAMDAPQAVIWYRRGMDAGNTPAIYHLALLLENGAGGVQKNPAEAAQLYQRAANAGFAPAKAKLTGGVGTAPAITGIDPPSISENKSQLYRLTGTGFTASTTVRTDVPSSVGSRQGQASNFHPVAVAPNGSWLAIYISLPPPEGRNTVKVIVRNPGSGDAALDVPIQR